MKSEAKIFPNLFYEILLRIRETQPRRFAKFSEGSRRQIERYSQEMARADHQTEQAIVVNKPARKAVPEGSRRKRDRVIHAAAKL